MTTMTSLYGGLGPQWQQCRIPVPEPGPGQVLVRARAAALNNADAVVLDQCFDPATGKGSEYLAGYEFAGDVAAVGDGVTAPAVGERVMGITEGAFAPYVLADHRHVIGMPNGLGFEEAATLPTALSTEYGALTTAGFRPGQSVLITGATAAIGLVGVQIAKHLGASTVLATTRTTAKADLLKEVGSDTVIVTAEQDLTAAVLDATRGDGVDVVLDHVGGPIFAACLPATRVDGHVVNIGRLDTAASTIDLDALSYRHLTLHGVSYGFSRPVELGNAVAALDNEVLPAVTDGRIRPLVDSVYDLDRAPQALARLRSHQAHGKVVLRLS
ncbi:zinc-binding dehydrogenase [Streptomyces sp. NPDC046942]|uniref:quinone oxidoreductase family protein n=1 Tax=Streptomyces sp. NPDC046942 TaxID=3155137 RepID=UPI0033D04338